MTSKLPRMVSRSASTIAVRRKVKPKSTEESNSDPKIGTALTTFVGRLICNRCSSDDDTVSTSPAQNKSTDALNPVMATLSIQDDHANDTDLVSVKHESTNKIVEHVRAMWNVQWSSQIIALDMLVRKLIHHIAEIKPLQRRMADLWYGATRPGLEETYCSPSVSKTNGIEWKTNRMHQLVSYAHHITTLVAHPNYLTPPSSKQDMFFDNREQSQCHAGRESRKIDSAIMDDAKKWADCIFVQSHRFHSSGIYAWIDTVTLQCYVGKSCDIGRRTIEHCSEALGHRKNITSPLLHNTILRQGLGSFVVVVLEDSFPFNSYNQRQQELFWISTLKSLKPDGFNERGTPVSSPSPTMIQSI